MSMRALFALFVRFLPLLGGNWIQFNPLVSCSHRVREREHETEKTETRNDGASSAALPSRGNKERPTMMIFSSS